MLGEHIPVLLDGSDDRRLRLELLRWLINPEIDQIDMAVSFIMKSGMNVIAGHLDAALQRGAHIRILTTDYLDKPTLMLLLPYLILQICRQWKQPAA